jgi:hypothetical protein
MSGEDIVHEAGNAIGFAESLIEYRGQSEFLSVIGTV